MIAMIAPYSRCKNAVNYITLRGIAVKAPWGRGNNAVASQRTPWERRTSAKHNHCVHTATLLRPYCSATAFPRRCWRPYGAAMAIVRSSHRALYRKPKDSVCFVHAQNKRRPSEFCRVLCDFTATPRRCLRSYCDHLGVLQF